MFIVYVLYSPSHNKIYVGFTADLAARLHSHNVLSAKGWTIRYRPWMLLHTETFSSKPEALLREKQLKSFQGRQFIRNLIK
jgi:putative endonuclease